VVALSLLEKKTTTSSARGAAHNPTTGSQSASLLKQQSRRALREPAALPFPPYECRFGTSISGGRPTFSRQLGSGRVRRSVKGPLFDVAECDAQHKNAASGTAKPPALFAPTASGFAFVPRRTVFLDGIVRAVETGQCRPTLPLLKEERAPSPTGEE
jgi:hypothetical protein